MHRRHKHDIIILFSLFAFAVSVSLATSHYFGFTLPCDLTHGCEAVLSSKYAILLGLPLSVWGIAYFTGVIIFSLLANHYAFWRKLLTVMLGVGCLGAVVFLSLQFFVIKQICQYCLAADLTGILIFLLDLNIEHRG
jgi:uncharacterized membrane protein